MPFPTNETRAEATPPSGWYHPTSGTPGWLEHALYAAQQRYSQQGGPYARMPLDYEQRVAPLGLKDVHGMAKKTSARRNRPGFLEDIGRPLDISMGINIPRQLDTDLARVQNQNLPSYIAQYLSTAKMAMDPMMQDLTENFMNKTLPSMRSGLAMRGAYNTGAAIESENQARKELGKSAQRRMQEMMASAVNQAREEAMNEKKLGLSTAEMRADILGKEKQHGLAVTRALSGLENEQQGREAQDMEIQRQLAHQASTRAQNIINQKILDHESETGHGRKMTREEIAALQGHPQSAQFAPNLPPLPPAPNPYATGAGMLSMMRGQGAKKGGHMKGYAPGGHIAPHPEEQFPHYQDKDLPAFQNEEVEFMRNVGRQLPHTHANPENAYWSNLGSNLLEESAIPFRDPVAALGRSTRKAAEHRDTLLDKNAVHSHNAANIMNLINQGRLDQQKVLAEYQQKQRDAKELARLHDAQIEASRAQAESSRAHAKLFEASAEEKEHKSPIKLTKSDEKDIGIVRENAAKIHGYNELWKKTGRDLEKHPAATGRFMGLLPNVTEDRQTLDQDFNSLVIPTVGEMGGVATGAKIKLAEATKPGFYKNPEVNKSIVDEKISAFDNIENENDFILNMYDYKGIPPRISRAAWDAWEANEKKGDLRDYLEEAIEGKLDPLANMERYQRKMPEQNKEGSKHKDLMERAKASGITPEIAREMLNAGQ